VGARDLSTDPVTVDVVFDRFPASVRGAVVVRGADADPHQVALTGADAVEVRTPRKSAAPVTLDLATVDLAPRAEIFVPFELAFGELGPGWYGVVAEVVVDGQDRLRSESPGKLFVVPWPAGTVRRGSVEVGSRFKLPGSTGPVVDRVECRPDRAVVRWGQPAEGEPFQDLTVLADGRALPRIEGTNREGTRTTVVYPVLKEHRTLLLRLERPSPAPGPEGPWEVEVPLA
jgi:hypothetical protein